MLVSDGRARVVDFGLADNPDSRYPSMDALLAELGHEPVPLRRRLALIAVVLLVAGGVGFGVWWRGRDARVCQGARDHLQGVWDQARRAEVSAAFRASGRSYAERALEMVISRLDSFADQWVAMRTEACQATRVRGEQSGELLDRRMVCLDRALGRMREMTEQFAGADVALVDDALAAVSRLPERGSCADREALLAAMPLPESRSARERVLALRGDIDRADALYAAAKYDQATELLQAVVEQARTLDYPPLLAEALAALGSALMQGGDPSQAEVALREAVKESARAHDDRRTAFSLFDLLIAVGYFQDRVDEGLALTTSAEAAVIRAGGEARARLDAAIRSGTPAWGEDSPDLAFVLQALGEVARHERKHREASELLERALRIRTGQPVDPALVAETRFALALTLWQGNRDRGRARQLAEQARQDYASVGARGADKIAEIEGWLRRPH